MSVPRAITGISKADSTLSHLSQPPLTLTVPADIPVASVNAINFINKIDSSDLRYTFFEDDLKTYTEHEIELGFYKASVKEECYQGEKCIAVEARSEGQIEGVLCYTHVTAILDSSLRTLFQELHEVVKLGHGPLDRLTTIKLESDGYRVHKQVQEGDKRNVMDRTFDRSIMDGYISEGANIVLQRLLIIKGVPDHFDVLSFDADTNLCLASYIDLADTKITLDQALSEDEEGTTANCFGIERRLHCITDVPVTWHTYFLSDGHLMSRTQIGSPILMKVRKLPQIIQQDEFLPVTIFPKKDIIWEDDLQFRSMFESRKETLTSSYRQYQRSHPELQALIADFLQSLLGHKPDDTLNFARNFFSSFSNRFVVQDPPHLHCDRPELVLTNIR